MTIPDNVREMAVEATSDHNDGWTKKIDLKRLDEIKRFIESILGRENDNCEYRI